MLASNCAKNNLRWRLSGVPVAISKSFDNHRVEWEPVGPHFVKIRRLFSPDDPFSSLSSKNAADKKRERLPTCSSRLPANSCPRDRSSISLTFDDPCQLVSLSLSLSKALSLQQDLAVPANTRVFAHVNARGWSHVSEVMLSCENVSLSSLGGPPMMIDHRFRHRRHGYPPKNRRTTHSKLALSLAGCTPRTSRREVGGFHTAKSRKRVFLSTREIRAATRGIYYIRVNSVIM